MNMHYHREMRYYEELRELLKGCDQIQDVKPAMRFLCAKCYAGYQKPQGHGNHCKFCKSITEDIPIPTSEHVNILRIAQAYLKNRRPEAPFPFWKDPNINVQGILQHTVKDYASAIVTNSELHCGSNRHHRGYYSTAIGANSTVIGSAHKLCDPPFVNSKPTSADAKPLTRLKHVLTRTLSLMKEVRSEH